MQLVLARISSSIAGRGDLVEWLQIAKSIGQTDRLVRQTYVPGKLGACCDLLGSLPGRQGWVRWEPFVAEYRIKKKEDKPLKSANISYSFGHLMALLCASFGANSLRTIIDFGIDFGSEASNSLTPLGLIRELSRAVSPHSVRRYKDKAIEGIVTLQSLHHVKFELEMLQKLV